MGTGVYIDDIEADAQTKILAIIDSLNATFGQTTILGSGCFWMFNGRGDILIAPRFPESRTADTLFSGSGTNLFQALVRAAHDPNRPYYHSVATPLRCGRSTELMCSRVMHFADLDWYIVVSVDTAEMWRPVRQILWKQTVFSVILVLLFILLATWLVNHVTRPLARLTGLTDQLQQKKFSLPAGAAAEFQAITFPRELGRLARAIASLVQKLQEYLKHLAESTAARERAESERRIAHDIQMSMLPDRLPELATRSGIDLHATLIPANEVGGDLYDFFMLDDHRLCIIVGDVSDKGVPASLFMARSKALLRAVAAEHAGPDQIFTKVNEELCRGNKLFMFVTAFLGIIDTQTFELAFSNTGHLPPYLLKPDGACTALTLTPHKPLGIVSRLQYTVDRLVLAPGDGCFIFTDEITEAINAREEMFEQPPAGHLGPVDQIHARETVETVLRAVNAFAGGIPQNDDIAALALRRCPEHV